VRTELRRDAKRGATALVILTLVFAVFVTVAPAASALDGGIEVTSEADGDPCDPCGLHVVAESYTASLATGAQISECDDELEGTIDADGDGRLVPVNRPHGADGCRLTKCADGDASWTLADMREVRARTVRVTVGMCLRGTATKRESSCDAEMTLRDYVTGPHLYATAFTAHCEDIRFESLMKTESYVHEAVEIVHSDSDG